MLIRDIIARMRHDGCGGRAGGELLPASRARAAARFGGSCCAGAETARPATRPGSRPLPTPAFHRSAHE